ncbi:MAG: hypothetical protein MR660_03845 [Peptoniphilaceae bacterium]|nr:hypothetical protein [Peptoniphilaceae bacterium]MCI6660386.1 hypothetical protein [Peptoniphilaceae bacterium]MDD7542911.1 hypothetical protein [Peptoniphilaceae bacterium]MDY4196712.1 hypothetical protein [Peptoniphilaceae bacterium]MDY5766385.1 hypothetical protein [Peptoniphilaceae bacterium]
MKKTKKMIFTMIFASLLICSQNAPVAYADGATLNAVVVPCKNPERTVTVSKSRQARIAQHMNVWYEPGTTASATETVTKSYSNSAMFRLIPELASIGYQESISATVSVGWSQKNNSSSRKELVVLEIYDVIKVTTYSKYENGYCTVGSTKYYNVVTGYGWGLR